MINTTETVPEIRCMRCKRILTSKRSIRNGYGPGCRIKLNDAAKKVAKLYTRAQIIKAATALRTGAIKFYDAQPDGNRYACESSSGRDLYYTTGYTCTCPASIRCYHQCGVMIRELTPLSRH